MTREDCKAARSEEGTKQALAKRLQAARIGV